jgi:hypothetical protein
MTKQQRKRQQVPAHPEPPDEATRRRVINDCVGYWRVCGAGACRRQRGCAGDAVACFERFWPWTPERIKIQIRASIKALSDGVTSADELTRIVDAEVERAAEHIARVDAETERAWDAKVAAERTHARIPSPLEGEGGRSERSEDRPGEGFASLNEETPHPPRSARHPLPQGERDRRRGPRVRAL